MCSAPVEAAATVLTAQEPPLRYTRALKRSLGLTSHVSLGLRHPRMDLVPIARALPFRVTRHWRYGEARRSPQGKVLPGSYGDCYVALKVDTVGDVIHDAVEAIHCAVQALPREVRDQLMGVDVDKRLCCCVGRDGESVELRTLETLLELNIRLEILGGHW